MAFRHVPLPWSPALPRAWLGRGRALARALSFWLAVALPLAYLPLVVLTPAAVAEPTVIVSLVGGNLVALVVGHGHEPALARRRADA